MKINYDRLINRLTFLYGLIPVVIFFAGWLRPVYSIPATLLIIYSGFNYVRRTQKNDLVAAPRIDWKTTILIALLAFIWVYCSGIGGYTNQEWDHHVRNAIFHDLLVFDWPIYYNFSADYHLNELAGNYSALNYYFTFWLPAALVGKFSGPQVANVFLLVWAYIGLLLSFYYLARLLHFKHVLLGTGLFILWGNYDIVSYSLLQKILPLVNISPGLSCFHFYTTFTTDLYNPFNQAIPAWLFTLYVLNNSNRLQLFPVIILLAYSPFAFIGLVLCHGLYFVVTFIKSRKKISVFLDTIAQSLWQPDSIGGITILVVYALFYQAHSSKVQNAAFWTIYADNSPLTNTYLMGSYLGAFFLEAGVYLSFIYLLAKHTYRIHKVWFWLVFAVLIVLPLWVIGVNNDLASRASIPFLTVLVIITTKALIELYETWGKSVRLYTIVCVLMVSFYWPLYSLYHSLTFTGKPVLKDAIGSLADPKIDEANDPEHLLTSMNNFYAHEPNHFFFYQYMVKK